LEVLMSAPSPIHRDPDKDGEDYGCVGRYAAQGNAAVSRLVEDVIAQLDEGELCGGEAVVAFMRTELEGISSRYNCGCCDTVVKENAFYAIDEALTKAGIAIDSMTIYGW
jgi:hypothetical protein